MNMRQSILFLFLLLLLAVSISAQDDGNSHLINDFEGGVPLMNDAFGNGLGLVPWGDTLENVTLAATQVVAFSKRALPNQGETSNTVLSIHYDIGAWGGFTQVFTDGENWISEDWTAFNALQFWLYGNSTNGVVQVEIFDNRNPDLTGDSAERWFYRITDDYSGWRQFTIPFELFQRRTDFQPNGAPNDGLGLEQVSGYAFGFPAGMGNVTAHLDNVIVVTVADTSSMTVEGGEEAPVVEIDESITWDSREWDLVWSDEFDGRAGRPISPQNWTCEIGGHGWGNNEHQYYTNKIANVSQDGNGNLAITAIQETPDDSECWYGECQYTSARCITMDKFDFTYGRVEARIQVPRGQGIWPAFWMLGANFPDVGWPNSGEIDIMEHVGFEPSTVHGTIHGPGYSGGQGMGAAYNINGEFADDFHVFAIDWDPSVIRWYVDGELVNILSSNDLNGRRWVFDHDFFLLLNVAVGGNWPGYPDETTEFPQTMLVDYVRVYQLVATE